jgi:hypothetical protein
MGRGGELVETPETLAYTAKRAQVLKSGKIAWEEVRWPALCVCCVVWWLVWRWGKAD